jgi:predicted nucleic acid-binding Zn ribbon protein
VRRREPRPLGPAVAALAQRLAPATPLADIQRVWPQAVGEAVAAEAEPTGERDGVVVVTCASAVWAQELDLMAPALIERLNAVLGAGSVRSLRCRCTPAQAWSRASAQP